MQNEILLNTVHCSSGKSPMSGGKPVCTRLQIQSLKSSDHVISSESKRVHSIL